MRFLFKLYFTLTLIISLNKNIKYILKRQIKNKEN